MNRQNRIFQIALKDALSWKKTKGEGRLDMVTVVIIEYVPFSLDRAKY